MAELSEDLEILNRGIGIGLDLAKKLGNNIPKIKVRNIRDNEGKFINIAGERLDFGNIGEFEKSSEIDNLIRAGFVEVVKDVGIKN